jgi:hypothetical protein
VRRRLFTISSVVPRDPKDVDVFADDPVYWPFFSVVCFIIGLWRCRGASDHLIQL